MTTCDSRYFYAMNVTKQVVVVALDTIQLYMEAYIYWKYVQLDATML